MNYSNLVSALEANDSERVNELIEAIYPRLMAFLKVHMNASTVDAEDCAQDTLLTSIEAIKEGTIKDPDRVVSYILSICRNTYLKKQKKKREQYLEEVSPNYHQAPRQLQSLLDEEQKQLLDWCLSQLKESYQTFMQYWFDHPDAHSEKVAKHFDITTSNAWTRKHRLIRKLNECYRKKSKL